MTLLFVFAGTVQARNYGICTRSEFWAERAEFGSISDANFVCSTSEYYGNGRGDFVEK
jgi:hypothetical protein